MFDTQCAAVYLTEKTDVAFRPFGLDLFDKLVRACKAVRARLESEQRAVASCSLTAIQAQIPVGTAVARLIANISSLTKPESVQALARVSAEEAARIDLLKESLLDLQANDPEKLIRQLTLRAGRVQALTRHLKDVEAALSAQTVAAVFDARNEERRKSEEAKRLREEAFPVGTLTGTGSESWTALWQAARRFSEENAYPDQAFPVVANTAHCVLCQQSIDRSTSQRLWRFEAFVASTTQRELRQARETFARLSKSISSLNTMAESIDETLKEIRIDHEAVADAIGAALATNEKRRMALVQALAEDHELPADCPALVSVATVADALAGQIKGRINALSTSATDEARNRMTSELQELRARKLLAKHE